MADISSANTCRLAKAGAFFTGRQGLQYAVGISAESVGSTALHLQLVTLPPLARAKAHKHEAHESAVYVLTGESGCWFGDRLEQHAMVRAGDFLYIPTRVPHLSYNPSETVPYVAVIARTTRTTRKMSSCSLNSTPSTTSVRNPGIMSGHSTPS